jgi:hypothetical protein
MTREEFIEKNAVLFWYMPKESLQRIDDEVLVEFIFNYGDWESVKELCRIIGFPKLKQVYQKIEGRKIGNYIPEMYNLLGLLVNKYA